MEGRQGQENGSYCMDLGVGRREGRKNNGQDSFI